MNINDVVKNLVSMSEKKYGKRWRSKLANVIYNFQDDCGLEQYRRVNQFYKPHGFELLAAGAFRMVYGYKDLIIKVDMRRNDGNSGELKCYNEATTQIPLSKYFICPMLTAVRYKKRTYLVFPKVHVRGDNGGFNRVQKKMWNISESLFGDMHDHNMGVFCNGGVAIDINGGFWDYDDRSKTKFSRFIKTYKNFWNEYASSFDSSVKALKKKHQIV